eukprot:758403-Hanusia_phi.AAC.4
MVHAGVRDPEASLDEGGHVPMMVDGSERGEIPQDKRKARRRGSGFQEWNPCTDLITRRDGYPADV